MSRIRGDQLRGHLETMILASLEQGEAHGLGILQRLDAAGCGLLKLKEGSLYPALYRLEEAGLVKSATCAVPTGRKGAPRRVYELTRKGKRSLEQGRREWREFASVISGVLGVSAWPQPSPAN